MIDEAGFWIRQFKILTMGLLQRLSGLKFYTTLWKIHSSALILLHIRDSENQDNAFDSGIYQYYVAQYYCFSNKRCFVPSIL